jgi:hypothetical protein
MLRTLSLAAALLLAAPAGRLGAQMQVVNPTALDPATPRAQRAKAAAELVLGGDRAKLDAWLKEHGAPELQTANLDRLLEAARTGPRTVLRYDDLPDGSVGVVLASAAGAEPERAIVVRLEPAAPHRVTRLGMAQLSTGG